MTQRNLEELARDQVYAEVKKDLTRAHLHYIFDIALQLGGMSEFQELLYLLVLEAKNLTLPEIRRALKREVKLKGHYTRQKEGGARRGGRHNKVAEIVDHIQDFAENLPAHLSSRLKLTAKYYGGYAPPETRISNTSQWRVNKRLKELGIDPVPWGEVRGVFMEDELELETMKRERLRRMKEEKEP